ncbi:MAG: AAA family ATPase [Actinobacteria bacterium]|nr:MAG: AAA family ATPase [Actinomycetota bacterium]REK37960.1 MAG: AAA family ATPase [Actinomycetota bacterium]
MHRIIVVGNSGSGKTTVARALAEKLDFPYLELDSIYHQQGWEPLPEDEFRVRVADFALQPSWVIDGNYTSLGMRDLIWPVADTLVWLDLSRAVVMGRVIARTVKRAITREELWNGNREPLSNFTRLDPEKNIIRWAWTRHDHYRQKYSEAIAEPDAVHLRVVRLQTTKEVDRFLELAS